jgi:hypothetical protein
VDNVDLDFIVKELGFDREYSFRKKYNIIFSIKDLNILFRNLFSSIIYNNS